MAENETKSMNTTKQKETQGAEKHTELKGKRDNEFREVITITKVEE